MNKRIAKNKKWYNACHIYIGLWVLWHMQGLFASSSLLSLMFYTPFILMTVFYAIKVYSVYNPKGVMLALCVFFMVLVIYGLLLLILNDAGNQDRKSFLMMLFWSLGPVFAFYVFTKQGLLTEERIKYWLIVFIIIVPYIYSKSRQLALQTVGSEYEETTVNAAYTIAGLFPFVFLLYKKPILQYLLIAFVFFFVVICMKRGAMLTMALMLVWFIYVSFKSSKRKKWGMVLLTIVFMTIGYRFVVRYFEQSVYFQRRVEMTIEGNSSNREALYGKFWQHWLNNDNVFQIIFGEGAYHTEAILFVKAHSDWLELLIDCGAFTVFLYVIYWISFIRDCRRCKSNYLVYSMMCACLIFTLSRSVFSMSFSDLPFFTSMIMGYCFANTNAGIITNQKNIANG